MDIISICEPEQYYFNKNNQTTSNKNINIVNNKSKNIKKTKEIKKSKIETNYSNDKKKNVSKVKKIKNNKSRASCKNRKPILHEEEQLPFELSLEEIEKSFDEMSLDLLKYNQLDLDINSIDVESQAYENIVELEFEYSDDE